MAEAKAATPLSPAMCAISCPVCRKETIVDTVKGSAGAFGLQPNRQLRNVVDRASERRKHPVCSNCDKAGAKGDTHACDRLIFMCAATGIACTDDPCVLV